MVPFPAGGPTDVTARVIGQALAEAIGVAVVIENKPGGRGFVGTTEVARAAPDGHTLLVNSIGGMAINPRLYDKLPYDSVKDFAPVSLLVTVPIGVVVNPEVLPVRSLAELLQHVKAHPGKVNYASAGSGGSSHLVPEYFKFRTGTFITHIPYQGTGPAVNDLLAGHVQLMFDTLLNSAAHIRSGKLRLLAVTTAQRLPQHPDVPTVAEVLKMPDFEATSWFGLYAPAGTPPDIVNRLASDVAGVLKQPAVARRLNELGAVPQPSSPQALAAFQAAEQAKWGQVIARAKIKPD
jgi:tripartite-type tricarboxylate transporter receptor subunit TctC